MTFLTTRQLSFIALFSLLFTSAFSVVAEDHDHSGHMHASADESSADSATGSQTLSYKYVCPMHPQIIRDHEGTCPICGMDLVKQAFENDMQSAKISEGGGQEGLKQGLAIRTTKVQRTTLWKYIPTFGRVVADQSLVTHVHPWSSGWIKDLAVRSNGERVKKGQLLYRLYAPEIVTAQQDLILAAENRKRLGKNASSLIDSARERLRLLGLERQTIRSIEKRKKPLTLIPVYAKQNGVVSNLVVQNGMYIKPETELMTITDLSQVWVEAEVLPLQQDWIETGLTVNITTVAHPDQRWESHIDYIYPDADTNTQALRVRLPLLNGDEKLKLNMLTDIEIYGGPKRDTLAIPMEALIDDGLRKRVVKQLDDGRFQVSEVVTGMQTKGAVEILAGLSEGEQIVVSGQFLIDSESQIQENLRRLMSVDTSNKPSQSESGFDQIDHSGHAH